MLKEFNPKSCLCNLAGR